MDKDPGIGALSRYVIIKFWLPDGNRLVYRK